MNIQYFIMTKIKFEESIIEDKRNIDDFNGITFSMFKKSQAKKKLLISLYNNSIEESNYWSSEFICCGAFIELWDIILEFMSKNIHLGNPKIPVYISKRFDVFKKIAITYSLDKEIDLRNNNKIRSIFSEIITILCLSKKKNKIEYVKINKTEDFDINKLSNKMKAPNISFATEITKNEDPKELFISINEIGYNISENVKNTQLACYWIEWIFEYERRCTKLKERCYAARRPFAPEFDTNGLHPVFIIWDIIIHEANKRENSKLLLKIIYSLIELFKIKYSKSCNKRRKHLIYYAITLLCEPFDNTISIIDEANEEFIKNIISNIHIIYKQIYDNFNKELQNDNNTNTNELSNDSNNKNNIISINVNKKKKGKNKLNEKSVHKLELINNLISNKF